MQSRCQILKLNPLADPLMETLLEKYLPDVSEHEKNMLLHFSKGSIGHALSLQQSGGFSLLEEMVKLITDLQTRGAAEVYHFAEKISGQEEMFHLTVKILQGLLARSIKYQFAQDSYVEIVPKEKEIIHYLTEHYSLETLFEIWEKFSDLLKKTESLYLDKKHVLICMFEELRDVH